MKLPCRHILAARSKLGMDSFDETLFDTRWSSEYYKASQRVLQDEMVQQVSFITYECDYAPSSKKENTFTGRFSAHSSE